MSTTQLRHTHQRQAVLRTVKLSIEPLTAEQVFSRVRKIWSDIGQATVYRNLGLLAKRGELYRIVNPDGVKRFVGHSIHQATFHCQRCGRSWDLGQNEGDSDSKKKWGDHTVFFSRLSAQGLCQSCLRILKKEGVRVNALKD